MSTYSLSDADVAAASAGSEGRAFRDFVRSSGVGVAAGLAWIAFGTSCLLWEDVGDWARTHSIGIGAFVVAATILFGTLGADYLGAAGRALRLRAPWLLMLGAFFALSSWAGVSWVRSGSGALACRSWPSLRSKRWSMPAPPPDHHTLSSSGEMESPNQLWRVERTVPRTVLRRSGQPRPQAPVSLLKSPPTLIHSLKRYELNHYV